jgi:hypothetical protein
MQNKVISDQSSVKTEGRRQKTDFRFAILDLRSVTLSPFQKTAEVVAVLCLLS